MPFDQRDTHDDPRKPKSSGETPSQENAKPTNNSNDLRHLQKPLGIIIGLRNWVVWKWEIKHSKWTKPPFIATASSNYAKNDDPSTWRSYNQACNAVENGKADGIGFNLLGTSIAAFDIDKCRDPKTGVIHPFALEMVKRAKSYTEITPSGTGLRIIGTASNRYLHRKLNGAAISVEFYRNCPRFITISNVPLEGVTTELNDIDALLDEMLDKLDEEKRPGTKTPEWDDTIIEEAKAVELNLIEPNLPDDLLALVRNGVPKVEDRSAHFHHAVGWLKDLDWSVVEIFALLRKYPKGIADKYLDSRHPLDRLSKESQRCYTKARESSPIEIEPEIEVEPESDPAIEEPDIEIDVEVEPESESKTDSEPEPEPEPEAPPPSAKDYIVMKGGKLVPIAVQAEAALIKSRSRIFQRKAHLVRPLRYRDIRTKKQLAAEAADENAIHRDRNSIVLQVIEKPHQLIGPMSTACKWYRQAKDADKSKKGEPKYKLVEADPDAKYATEILSRVGQWSFPVLRGVIAAPTLDRQGNVIEKPDYDESSGLLLDFKAGDFTPVPINPTKEDALAAMAKINHPLRGFPFDGENENVKVSASRSVILSAILCAPIRPALRIVPLHGINSPMAGTGKSMLAKIPAIIATGVAPTVLNQGQNPEEDEKRLSVALNEGDAVILIDNCERPITGSFLCQMLTEEQVQARILGLSERRLLPNNSLVIANGNNLVYAGDVVRRSLDCRLNADKEHPENREFDFNAVDEVWQQRHELLVAVLTILRAYRLVKPIRLKPMGDFKDYEWIRGALVWLGQTDPIESQKDLFAYDPMKDSLLNILSLWDDGFGQAAVTVGELAVEKNLGEYAYSTDPTLEAKTELRQALIEEACYGKPWNSKSVGWWLRRSMDKYAGGMCLKRQRGDNDRTTIWKLYGGKGPAKRTEPPAT
jgi:hypothetical protein